jgi:hypothetical protein
MFDYVGNFQSAIAALKRERRYRVFADLERNAGRFPHAFWNSPSGKRDVVVRCSNDARLMRPGRCREPEQPSQYESFFNRNHKCGSPSG